MRYHRAMKKPHSDRSQGRKPLSPDEPTVSLTIRMPESLRDALKLKGAEWARTVLARALKRAR